MSEKLSFVKWLWTYNKLGLVCLIAIIPIVPAFILTLIILKYQYEFDYDLFVFNKSGEQER